MKHRITKESLPILLIALTLTCAIGTFGLAYTYNCTKSAIEASAQKEQMDTIKKVLPSFNEPVIEKTVRDNTTEHTVFIAKNNGAVVGIAMVSSSVGYGGDVKLMVGIIPDNTIYGVELLQHQETPGLGAKAGNASFTQQFIGKTLVTAQDVLSVIKAGEKSTDPSRAIEAITAATITSKAFTKAVNEALHIFITHKTELIS